ncbi:hypothetical protein [Kushneria aurantia]|uniref:Uncharacterized protein n=1 Tax=Kushneria aurantia TaxID=504092 RepID=A0ABV6G6F6_9GAMM|nr:hypothetical protein [Kushneria aurantia]
MQSRTSLAPLLLVMTMAVVYSISRDPALSAIATLVLAPLLVVAARALTALACRSTRSSAQRTTPGGRHDPESAPHFIPCAFCREPRRCQPRRD